MSSIEHSHSEPITDLQWIPDHFQVRSDLWIARSLRTLADHDARFTNGESNYELLAANDVCIRQVSPWADNH